METNKDFNKKSTSIDWNRINLFCVAGIVVGVIGIIIGIILFNNGDLFGSFSALKFGADFYTEMHQMTTSVANQVGKVGATLTRTLGMLHMLIGGLSICYFGDKLVTQYKANPLAEEKKESTDVFED